MNTETLNQMIPLETLSADAFRPFGEVIEGNAGTRFATNGNTAIRSHAISPVDCSCDGGAAHISMFHIPNAVPIGPVRMLERHPISSQAFIPLDRMRLIIIVAVASAIPDQASIRAFVTDGRQGVNYRRGTWHHPLIALEPGSLLIIDRSTSNVRLEQDYEEHWLSEAVAIRQPSMTVR